MNNGSTHEYKFGQKNNWRRQTWNRIIGLLKSKPSESIVFYLAGELDMDRPVATSKGFKDCNMIAVDRSLGVVKSLRANGVIAVKADVLDVLKSMKDRVDVIHLDLCCGITEDVISMLCLFLLSPSFDNTVISINLLRGRDPESVALRTEIEKSKGMEVKHRGEILFEMFKATCVMLARKECCDPIEYAGFHFSEYNQVFASYKSTSNQVFDSIVFRNRAMFLSIDCYNKFSNQNTVRKIAAAKAVRTMRQS